MLEYAVLVSVVSAALVAMHTYVQRAVQANLKNIEDELGIEEPVE
jgi:Flp pilus assembly pilin Flp